MTVLRTESSFCAFFFCLKFLKGFEWCFAVRCFSAKCHTQSAVSHQIRVSGGNHGIAFPCIALFFLHKKVYLNDSLNFLYLLFNSVYLQNPLLPYIALHRIGKWFKSFSCICFNSTDVAILEYGQLTLISIYIR